MGQGSLLLLCMLLGRLKYLCDEALRQCDGFGLGASPGNVPSNVRREWKGRSVSLGQLGRNFMFHYVKYKTLKVKWFGQKYLCSLILKKWQLFLV